MVDFNLTYGEIADFQADMLEMAADQMPTNEEMEELAAYWGEG